MVKRTSGAARKAPAKRAGHRGSSVVVSEQERRHLIDDIAYFHAERYRPAEPGDCREEDRREAEAEIEAVLHRRRRS